MCRRVALPLTSLIVQRKRTFCARSGAEDERVSIVVVIEKGPDVFSHGYSGGVARPNTSEPQQATEPSLLTPQVCAVPALTETKEPAGGVAWPWYSVTQKSLPQQATEPSLLIPQVWSPPALTELKEPAGGVALPLKSLPQQATEPSLLTPQEYPCPALTETKEPVGGGDGAVGAGVAYGSVASPSVTVNAKLPSVFSSPIAM